jgi:hypothetical protein
MRSTFIRRQKSHEIQMNWLRTNRSNPCKICEHPDWCTFSEIGACCMRVQSSRPMKNGGWLHRLDAAPIRLASPEPTRPTIDAERLARGWFNHTTRADFNRLAGLLGVSPESLIALKCGWSVEHCAWSFPMRDGAGRVCGIRLRNESGRKWSVTGGREGIFLPATQPNGTAFVCEGPTDAAALLTLGKFVIGRPSCSGGIAHLSATVGRLRIHQAVIIADNDEDKFLPNGNRWNPGLDGAKRLAEEIGVPCAILILPCKDCREFLSLGGTSELLDSLVQSCVWHQPKTKSGETHAKPGEIVPNGKNLSSTKQFSVAQATH